jgi:hypothetical protein
VAKCTADVKTVERLKVTVTVTETLASTPVRFVVRKETVGGPVVSKVMVSAAGVERFAAASLNRAQTVFNPSPGLSAQLLFVAYGYQAL